MTAKEKFNSMSAKIEELAKSKDYLKPREIGMEIANHAVIGYRDLNTVFTYLTGISLLDYIRERQIMAAYKTIISMPIFDVEIAISVSGLDNQSSFGKRFKERFGITPKEAFNLKDESKLAEQITWDIISNGNNLFEAETKEQTYSPKKFGLPEEEYQRIQQAADLQLLFELDDIQSEVAFTIAKQEKADIKKVFGFVADYCVFLDYDIKRQETTYEILLNIFNAFPELRFVYLYVIDEIGTAIDLVGEIKVLGYNPMSFSPDFLKMYVEEDSMDFKEFLSLAKKYEEVRGGIDSYFSEFIIKIRYGMDFDEAIREEDYMELAERALLDYNKFEDDFDDPMLKWIEEETDYTNSDRFDDDYDEDSAYYDGDPYK